MAEQSQPLQAAPSQAASGAPASARPASHVQVTGPQESGPVVQPWIEPTPGNWQPYRNAQGRLPSTSVGGQVITASPAYSYRDAAGNLVVDYPVSIAASPATIPTQSPGAAWPSAAWRRVQSAPVYTYGGGCYGGACYGGGCASCR